MKFLALVLPFALAGSTPALAQQLPATPEISATSAQTAPVFRSGASLVALNVSVLDSSRNFVTGLGPDDFAVYEDGVQQQVRFFDATEVPLDLIILLDTSASMSDKMDVVHAAAAGFLVRATMAFAQVGIPVERVITDNGGCYRSHAFAAVAAMLEVRLRRTRPFRPQTNGKAEAFNKTLQREWAYRRPYYSNTERLEALPIFLQDYNYARPHTSIGNLPPASRL